ncbi:MAG TPA: hypothetical protein VG326_07020, partial [Tepidisphaeraceae bacterium]|nr:hypothetical protein [Tepidisphaeraceae bacterium]
MLHHQEPRVLLAQALQLGRHGAVPAGRYPRLVGISLDPATHAVGIDAQALGGGRYRVSLLIDQPDRGHLELAREL